MKFSPFQIKFTLAAIKTVFITALAITIHTQTRAAGVLDPAFGTNGSASTIFIGESVRATATLIQPDGKIVVVGDVLRPNTMRDIFLARYNANGTLDTSFGDGGKVYTAVSNRDEAANAAAIQPDGKIVVVGSTQPFAEFTSGNFLAVRYNPNGSLDSTFGAGGTVTIDQSSVDVFNAVALQPDGKIVAAGTTSQNYYDYAVVRFNHNGTLDASFADGGLFFLDNGGFYLRDEIVRAIGLFPNGRILLYGSNRDCCGGDDVLIALEPNGALAADFGNNGVKFESAGMDGSGLNQNLSILPDGRFLVIGRSSLRRYLSNGTLDPTFNIVYAESGGGYAGSDVVVTSEGKIIVTQRINVYRPSTTIYNADGRIINRFINPVNGNSTLYSDIAIQPDNKFVLVRLVDNALYVSRYISITSQATRLTGFDYNEISDLAVYRASNRTTYVLLNGGSGGYASYNLNDDPTRIIPEDYGSALGQFRLFYWQSATTAGSPAFFRGVTEYGNTTSFQWGASGDIPVGGNYDGDSRTDNSTLRTITDFAVFRPSNGAWYILNSSNNQFRAVQFGQAGDKPVPADYDYDGITDIAVFRPSNGGWYVLRSSDNQFQAVGFGQSGDIPLTGDFDGDGRADFTVYRPSNGTWYSLQTTNGFRAAQFGISTDQPVPGDYDGDGRHDFAVFRDGYWYILGSTRGFYAVQWGLPSDTPVAVRYAY